MLHTPPPTHQEGGSTNYISSKKMNSEVTTNDKARVRRGWVASIWKSKAKASGNERIVVNDETTTTNNETTKRQQVAKH